MKQYLKEISFLLGSDRQKLFGLLFLFLISSLLELMGIGLIGPYLSIVVEPEGEIWRRFNSSLNSINVFIPHQQILFYLSLGLVITFFISLAQEPSVS